MTDKRHTYLTLIGDSPTCAPDDREAAAAYLVRIEAVLSDTQATLTPAERHRLIEKRVIWRKRVDGRDPRFRLVGTKPGRLSADVEQQIRAEIKTLREEDIINQRCSARRDHRSGYGGDENAAPPEGFAKGGPAFIGGWECPRCQTINAPWMPVCGGCPK
jgi:hypothetical protein